MTMAKSLLDNHFTTEQIRLESLLLYFHYLINFESKDSKMFI